MRISPIKTGGVISFGGFYGGGYRNTSLNSTPYQLNGTPTFKGAPVFRGRPYPCQPIKETTLTDPMGPVRGPLKALDKDVFKRNSD
jgi:hypothetical protein